MTLDASTGSGLQKEGSFWRKFCAEYTRRILHPVTLIACLSCSLLFAFIGPYDTYSSDPLLFRLIFWSSVVVSSCVLAIFFGVWANLKFEHKPFWFHSAVGGILFSIVYFILMWLTLNTLYTSENLPHPAELFAVIVSISAMVYACMWCFSAMLENRIAEMQAGEEPYEASLTRGSKTPSKPIAFERLLSDYKKQLFDPINIAICTFGSLLFAFIGPYGTHETETFLFRFLFWSLLVWSTSLLTMFFAVWANHRHATHPFWFQSATGGTIFSAIYLFLIWIALRAVYPPFSDPGHVEFFFITLTITSLIYISMWYFAFLIEARVLEQQAQTETLPDLPPASTPKEEPSSCVQSFLSRIGPNAGNRLTHLSMSDHYIEAYTDTGMHLLYMRFADALEELSSVNGTQVHRSHWVNFDEVDTIDRDGAKLAFVMSDGSAVPVSRSRKKHLQDLGVL